MNEELTAKEKEELVLGIHDDEAVAEFKAWSEDKAEAMAKELGLELTPEHWNVIKFLRLHFSNTGPVRHARELIQVLSERFVDEGGSAYLYQLFPQGPINLGCRIAGIPVPSDATNSSFGSTF